MTNTRLAAAFIKIQSNRGVRHEERCNKCGVRREERCNKYGVRHEQRLSNRGVRHKNRPAVLPSRATAQQPSHH